MARAWARTWRGTPFERGHCRDLRENTPVLPACRSISRKEGSYGFLPWRPGEDSGEASRTYRAGVAPGLDPELAEVTELLIGGWVAVPPDLNYPGSLLLRLLRKK